MRFPWRTRARNDTGELYSAVYEAEDVTRLLAEGFSEVDELAAHDLDAADRALEGVSYVWLWARKHMERGMARRDRLCRTEPLPFARVLVVRPRADAPFMPHRHGRAYRSADLAGASVARDCGP